MPGASKEIIIAGPGSGKTTYLASLAIQPGSVSLDPVGALRRLVAAKVDVFHYDKHNVTTFRWLQEQLRARFKTKRAVLIDISELMPDERDAFCNEFGYWLRAEMRDGKLIVDEMRWLFAPGSGSRSGLFEFIGKCRNYNVSFHGTAHRPAGTNTDVAGLCDTFRVGRMAHPLDLEAATKLLKSKVSSRDLDELAARLPRLAPGHWLVMRAAAPG